MRLALAQRARVGTTAAPADLVWSWPVDSAAYDRTPNLCAAEALALAALVQEIPDEMAGSGREASRSRRCAAGSLVPRPLPMSSVASGRGVCRPVWESRWVSTGRNSGPHDGPGGPPIGSELARRTGPDSPDDLHHLGYLVAAMA